MILVMASAVDDAAVEFAEEISAFAAASVVTCKNLATESMALRYPNFLSSTFSAAGRVVSASDVRCIINLLPVVFPDELFFYPSEERDYQAAEFHALLTFFLSGFTCPVINRPTSMSLTGACSSPIGWYHLARKHGIPVVEVQVNSDEFVNPFGRDREQDALHVTYLHGEILSGVEPILENYTRMLAEAAQLEYVRATFVRRGVGFQLSSANTVPALRDPRTRTALIDLLTAIGAAE